MRIKTTRTLTADPTESTVTIERLDDYERSHDLERSREIAPSGLAIQLARAEAEKGYSAAQILNALRGVGTAKGSKRLEEVGGAHLSTLSKIGMMWVIVQRLNTISEVVSFQSVPKSTQK